MQEYHYFNKELVDDPAVDVDKPEVLVYAPGRMDSSSPPWSGSSRVPSGPTLPG
jgi:hypothetical protein